jgi:cysteine desulfurase
MTRPRTYLDWNATAPLRPQARAAMVAALDAIGNPSSVHAEGRHARRLVEDAREQVAALVGAQPGEVVFTSGATEANVWVHSRAWRRIFCAGIEHPSVLAPTEAGHTQRIALPVGRDGVVDRDALASILAARGEATGTPPGASLLSLQWGNNETGVIQPIAEAVEIAVRHGDVVVSDAVQAAGRVPLDFARSGLAYMTVSAHKLGGPKGIGALIVRSGTPMSPLLTGGGQERRLRAGTENVAAIAGFGAAADAAAREIGSYARIESLRDGLEAEVRAIEPKALIVGGGAPRLPNTSCIALPSRSAETAVVAFDLAGVAVSAGAACSSGKVAASHVLAAMGLSEPITRSAIRVSLGPTTTQEDIAAFMAAFMDITGRVARAA